MGFRLETYSDRLSPDNIRESQYAAPINYSSKSLYGLKFLLLRQNAEIIILAQKNKRYGQNPWVLTMHYLKNVNRA